MTEPSKVSSAPVVPEDWPAQAADRIEGLVGTVRDKTTGPVMTASRWVVFGTLMFIVAIAASVVLTTLILRLLHSYLPFGDATNVWVSYFILGIAATIGGLVLLARANKTTDLEIDLELPK